MGSTGSRRVRRHGWRWVRDCSSINGRRGVWPPFPLVRLPRGNPHSSDFETKVKRLCLWRSGWWHRLYNEGKPNLEISSRETRSQIFQRFL
ncbi:hypothetical protein U1Q18_023813 [Sarracenia purpurea var. burkii]